MKKIILSLVVLSICYGCRSTSIIYDDTIINRDNWVVEQQPGGSVIFENKQIEIADALGCTVWLKHKLTGAIKIEYDVIVIDEGGEHDRVSDLNSFWMASDPKNKNNFFKTSIERAGKFSNYHGLAQYYVGLGGHNNTKTRFRRYTGDGERPLLREHDLSNPRFLIPANKQMHITLIAKGNDIKYLRDGEVIFEMQDSNPYTSGYFGFRTVNNHMRIKNIQISKIH
jgi:uncharacterized protein YcfL